MNSGLNISSSNTRFFGLLLAVCIISCQTTDQGKAGLFELAEQAENLPKYSLEQIPIAIPEFTLRDFEPLEFDEYLVAGHSWSPETGDDFACAKVDKLGNVIWEEIDINPGQDHGRFITRDKKGLFMIGGFKYDSLNNRQIVLQKTTSLGKTWRRSYDIERGVSDEAYKLLELKNGDYLLTGFTKAKLNSFLLRVSRQGALVKKMKYGGDHKDYLFDAVELDNSDIIAVGSWGGFYDATGNDFTIPNADMMIVRTNKALQEIWLKRIDHGGHDVAHRIFRADPDHVYIAGTSQRNNQTGFDFYLAKADNDGNIIWEKFYGDDNWDYLTDAIHFKDQIILVGTSKKAKSIIKVLFLDQSGELVNELFISHKENIEAGNIRFNEELLFIGTNVLENQYRRSGHILKLTTVN